MSSITIRNLDDSLKASLRVRAARHGVLVEQEKKNILQSTLAADVGEVNGLEFALRIKTENLQRLGDCLQQLMKTERHARAAV
jgi:plasmid stability protein